MTETMPVLGSKYQVQFSKFCEQEIIRRAQLKSHSIEAEINYLVQKAMEDQEGIRDALVETIKKFLAANAEKIHNKKLNKSKKLKNLRHHQRVECEPEDAQEALVEKAVL